MKKSKSVRMVVIVSDLHCGSTVGLLPPDFVTLEGNEIQQNAVQRWLWECWTDATERWLPSIVGSDPFALVVLGDAVEGDHHRTTQIISKDMIDHRNAAVECLSPMAKRAAATFVVEGTECHVGNVEHTLAGKLKAVPDPDTGKPAWERLDLTVAGTRSIFQHHITVAIRSYLEASGLGIALGNEQLEAAKNGEQPPKCLFSAHRHRYGEFRDASGLCVVSPPWQVKTRHGMKVVPSARTRPGLVVADWRGLPDGSLPTMHAMIYWAPQPKGARL